MHLLAAKVWNYWISYVLIGAGILMLIATFVGYMVKVYSTKFPKQ
jgi:hypothetical protein